MTISAADYEVLIVGAGPVGLTMAIDLGQRGVRTLIVERDPTTGPWPKMDRSNARTMEIYRRLGFADRVRALGYPPEAPMDVFIVTRLDEPPLVKLHYPSVGESREKTAASTDMSQPLEPYQLVSQNRLEPLLKEIAEGTPNVTVHYGCPLTAFEQDEDGVSATIEPIGKAPEHIRVRYMVGCDGGSSMVRKSLGFKLEGPGNLRTMKQICFHSDELYDRIPMGKGRHYYFADAEWAMMVVQGDRKEFTLNVSLPDDADFGQEILARVGFPFEFNILNVGTWRLHLLVADRYRDRRVLIAGDAVHLVIPTGGLGMNTGIGDAVDLSWKLAGTLAGWGGPGLLDSYETERRRVGLRNRDASGWAAEGMALWHAHVTPAIRDDTAEGVATREEVSRAAEQHHRRVHEMIGVEYGYSYANTALIDSGTEEDPQWQTTVYEPHAQAGVRIPHVWLKDGRAIQDALGRDWTLLDLTGAADTAELLSAFAEIGAPIELLASDEPHVREIYDCSLLLVRPDLHIAWSGTALPTDSAGLARKVTGHATEKAA